VTSASSLQEPLQSTGAPDPDLERLRDLIYQVAGIYHPENKLRLLLERCSRRMRELKIPTVRDYISCLMRGEARQAELIALLNEITIGETYFFRNIPQLQALRRIILPNILRMKSSSAQRRLRIWSAGCSTGEEPYTLRMVLLEEAERLLKGWQVEILGTDINQQALAHAETGVYDKHSTRNLPALYREKYFVAAGGDLQVAPNARAGITFSRLNLSDDQVMSAMQNIDAIFCCNVLIYFDLVSKRRVIGHFFNNLLPHGYLFLGPAESLYGVSDDFSLVHLPGSTAYVKRAAVPVGRDTI
jgi:chemotaxis protein methyltransferase CheR